jgi:hypothetical protein
MVQAHTLTYLERQEDNKNVYNKKEARHGLSSMPSFLVIDRCITPRYEKRAIHSASIQLRP